MNNFFKRRFRRKLGISKLLVECEKVTVSLRSNELDADFKLCPKISISYIPNIPMLKIAAESYIRRMYSEFDEEFKKQFTLSCKLLQADLIVEQQLYSILKPRPLHALAVCLNA